MRFGNEVLELFSPDRERVEILPQVRGDVVTDDPAKIKKLRDDPVVFANVVLEFDAFDYQQKILRDNRRRIVACMGRQTGKTTTISAKAIQFAVTHPRTTTLIVSPSLRQSGIMFDRISGFLYASKALKHSIVRITRTVIQFTNGAQIVALPCSEHMLRGYTAHMVICDEAAFMPEATISGVLFPMLATTKGTLIMLSTPWSQDNLFYRAFMDPAWSVHKVKSIESPLITEEFLEEQKKMMTEEQFSREYLAEFSEAASSYFPQDLIRQCVVLAETLGLEMGDDIENFNVQGCFAGVDLGKKQDYTVISAIKCEGESNRLVFHKQFELGTPYPEIIGALHRLHEVAPFNRISIDRTGIGEAVLDELQDLPVDGIIFTTQSKADMLGTLRVRMEQDRLVLPYDRELCAQLNEQRFNYSKNGRLKFWHPPMAHDDRLWSLALAVYGARAGAVAPPISIGGP